MSFSPDRNNPRGSSLPVPICPPCWGRGHASLSDFRPAAYFDHALEMPPGPATDSTPEQKAQSLRRQIDWLRRSGVTHVLAFEPLDAAWPVRLVWEGVDPLLNPAWARLQPLLLYKLEGSRGRIAWESAAAEQEARVTDYQPTRVAIEALCRRAVS